jgi:hypothetical protein
MEPDKARKIRAWASAFDDAHSSLTRVLMSHEFTSSIEVVVPSSSCLGFVADLLLARQGTYFRGDEYAVNLLSQPHFDGVSVICEGTDWQTDDCVQRFRAGALVVQATHATHLRLGLDAKLSDTGTVWRSREEKSERTMAALQRLPVFRCLGVSNNEGEVNLPVNWTAVKQEFSTVRHRICVPLFSFSPDNQQQEMVFALDWVGAAVVGAGWPIAAAPEGPETEVGIAQLRGMICSSAIVRLIEQLREQRDGAPLWCMLVVRGFDDDIEAEGENNIVVVIKPGGKDYWALVVAKKFPL